MRNAFLLSALLLLLSCSPRPTPEVAVPAAQAAAAASNQCRVGRDGGPAVADRGIGGTGISAGGDGRVADRGIGGTGIIGVITGFGSICVNGLEVTYDPATPVQVDGVRTTSTGALRAGQVTAIQAAGSGTDLHATSVAIRHEVSGPVEAVEQGGAVWIVAGQTVVVSPSAWGKTSAGEGEWVSISGVRDLAGTIVASRIDPRIPGRVTIHGTLTGSGASLQMGNLPVRFAPGLVPPPGRHVVVSGTYGDGRLLVDSIVPDLLASNPAAYFGDAVDRLFVESYAEVVDGRVRVGPGWEAQSGPGLASGPSGLTVIEFGRARGGVLVATSLRDVSGAPTGALPSANPWSPGGGSGGAGAPFGRGASPAARPGSAFTPAPMPSPQALGTGGGIGRGFANPGGSAPGNRFASPPAPGLGGGSDGFLPGSSGHLPGSPPAGFGSPPSGR